MEFTEKYESQLGLSATDGGSGSSSSMGFEIRRLRLVALLLTVSAAPAIAQTNWPYRDTVARTDSVTLLWGALSIGSIVGLPALSTRSLPAGYSEYRFELGCGACLPAYAVRIRAFGTVVMGEAYTEWYDPKDSNPTDTRERVAGMRRTPKACATPLLPSRSKLVEGTSFHPTWCEVKLKPGESWNSLFDRLKNLGILELGTLHGENEYPAGVAFPSVNDHGWCLDIGGQSLMLTTIDGDNYRSGFYGCLERKYPEGSKGARLSAAFSMLRDALPTTVELPADFKR